MTRTKHKPQQCSLTVADDDWRDGRRKARVVTVVWGPPAAGKTTYVSEHSERGDLIVDFDAILRALSGCRGENHSSTWLDDGYERNALVPWADEARNHLLSCIGQAAKVRKLRSDVWVISVYPERERAEDAARTLGAEMIEINPGLDECVKRARADRTRDADEAERIVRAWFEKSRGQSR